METNWNQILGHVQQKAELRALLRAGRLPHALLFSGPAGIGKRKIAHVLAAALLCGAGDAPCGSCTSCQQMRLGDSHPDYYELVPEQRGKSAAMIRIEQVRELQTEASRAPVLAQERVLVIDEADRMNEAAANSLLKTIEEPAGARTFILITSARAALLDTIISRCMPFTFGRLQTPEVAQILVGQGVPEAQAAELAALSDGSAARALELQAEQGLALRDEALAFLVQRQKLDLPAIWRQAAALEALPREQALAWLAALNMLLRDLLVLHEDGGSALLYHLDRREALLRLLPTYPVGLVFQLLGLVRELQRRLQTNASLRLQVEGFLLRACAL